MSDGLSWSGKAAPMPARLVDVHGVTCVVAAENPARTAKWASVLSRLSMLPAGMRVTTASSGGHGCAVALISQQLALQATVVVPSTARADRLQLLEQTGCRLISVDGSYEECKQIAQAAGGYYLSGFDDLAIIEGHTWMFPFPSMTVPIGGGGLFAAALLAHGGKAIGVEHYRARAMSRSLEADGRVYVEVEGAVGAVAVPQVGSAPFELVRAYRPRIVAVTDTEIEVAQQLLWAEGVQAELAGAIGLAGALATGARATVVTGMVL